MSTNGQAARDPVEGPKFEQTSVPTRGVVTVAAGLIGLILVSMAIVAGVLSLMPNLAGKPPAQGVIAVPQEPPAPRLEVFPRGDRAAVESAGRMKLSSFGWADAAHGYAHIPIERAMEILAARGWPDGGEARQ